MNFFETVAQALRSAGFDAEYNVRHSLRIGNLDVSCFTRRNRNYVGHRSFLNREVTECIQYIVQSLSRWIADKEAMDKRAAHQLIVRPSVAALRQLGYSVSHDGRSFTLPADQDYEHSREFLRFLVGWEHIRRNGIHYDQAAFLNCILDNPGDVTPILVYADWLEENGHEADAMKLRNAVEEEK